jgi:hypothetical protein
MALDIQIFLDIGVKFLIVSILMILEYIIKPIELIDKYKSALPDEMQFLIFSTGMLIVSLALLVTNIYMQIKGRKFLSKEDVFIIIILNAISIILAVVSYKNLETKFIVRHDPFFDDFIQNYFIYVGINVAIVIFFAVILEKVEIIRKLWNSE